MQYKPSISPEELERLPLAAFGGIITVVDSLGTVFDNAIRYLARQKVIGFDTETRPSFVPRVHYGTALLQLSGKERAFLFRVGKLGMPRKLCRILSSEKIVKVGAAVRDDIRGLQRYSSFRDAAFVDLQHMAEQFGITDKAVKKLSGIILGVRISKNQQLSNWEADSLNDAQTLYAATDAWICREMYMELIHHG